MLCRGISAMPEAPTATRVRKGPSLIFRMAWAAMSVSSPKVPARDMNRPPLELVTALMMAMVERPRTPAVPKMAPITQPSTAPARNFANSRTKPRLRICPPWRSWICAPTQNRKMAMAVLAPPLDQSAVT